MIEPKIRKMIYSLLIASLLSATLLLSACANIFNSAGKKTIEQHTLRIGVTIFDDYDTLMTEMAIKINDWARETARVEGDKIVMDIVSANGSQLTQNDQVAKFADKGYDVVCVNLVDRTDATMIIDKARSAGIPVIFFNREPVAEDLDRWEQLYYVGADAEQAGALQAELITQVLSDQKRFDEVDRNGDHVIQYVILEGEPGHQDSLVRTQVSIEQIQESGIPIEKVGDEIANWNRTQAFSKMNMLLEKRPLGIEMVIANDDDMALGVLDAILSKGAPLPLIVGVNGTAEALEMVKTQKMAGTVYNDLKQQAELMMNLAYSLAKEGTPPANYRFQEGNLLYVDYRPIDYDNVQEFIRLQE